MPVFLITSITLCRAIIYLISVICHFLLAQVWHEHIHMHMHAHKHKAESAEVPSNSLETNLTVWRQSYFLNFCTPVFKM
jgi:hypothetical protein